MINSIKTKIILLLVIVPACFLCDQLTKWLVFGNGDSFIEWLFLFEPAIQNFESEAIFSFFNVVKVWNFGISFGMLAQDDGYGQIILILLASLIATAFTIWMFFTNVRIIVCAIPILVGGAIGNIWDRIRFDAVADFLDFHVLDFHYPAFNIADSFVFIAIALIIYDGVFLEKKREDSSKGKNND